MLRRPRLEQRSLDDPKSVGNVTIITLPLEGNYGGVMQAWALQQALSGLHTVTLADMPIRGLWDTKIGRPIRNLLLAGERVLFRQEAARDAVREQITSQIHNFVRRAIKVVSMKSVRASIADQSQGPAYIVGSDQVWRPKYSNIPIAMLDFVPANFARVAVSYAASFGEDRISGWTPQTVRKSRARARRFDAISVRETSGIKLVSELWGRDDAVRMPDPTLLLAAKDYLRLIADAPSLAGRPEAGGVVSYVLDVGAAKSAVVDEVSAELDLHSDTLLRPQPRDIKAYNADPERYNMVPVETWLAAIRDAAFLVTDSFHGCVFAIIFNTPFVAIGNAKRGLARFETLLSVYRLQDRLIDPDDLLGHARARELARSPIDWDCVNSVRLQEQQMGLAFLKEALLGDPKEAVRVAQATAASREQRRSGL